MARRSARKALSVNPWRQRNELVHGRRQSADPTHPHAGPAPTRPICNRPHIPLKNPPRLPLLTQKARRFRGKIRTYARLFGTGFAPYSCSRTTLSSRQESGRGRRRSGVGWQALAGFNSFDRLVPLRGRLHEVGCARDRAGNRTLHYGPYCLLLLPALSNPTLRSLRALQQASPLKKVQRQLGCPRASLGSLSEAGAVVRPHPPGRHHRCAAPGCPPRPLPAPRAGAARPDGRRWQRPPHPRPPHRRRLPQGQKRPDVLPAATSWTAGMPSSACGTTWSPPAAATSAASATTATSAPSSRNGRCRRLFEPGGGPPRVWAARPEQRALCEPPAPKQRLQTAEAELPRAPRRAHHQPARGGRALARAGRRAVSGPWDIGSCPALRRLWPVTAGLAIMKGRERSRGDSLTEGGSCRSGSLERDSASARR